MSHDLRLRRRLSVPPDVAFHHWVDADARRRWYQGDEPSWIVEAATDLRVGGRFYVRWGPTREHYYEEDGVFEVVDPPHRLVYVSRVRPPTGETAEPLELRVIVTFEAQGAGTLLELVETGFPTADARDAVLRDGITHGLDFYERSLPSRHD